MKIGRTYYKDTVSNKGTVAKTSVASRSDGTRFADTLSNLSTTSTARNVSSGSTVNSVASILASQEAVLELEKEKRAKRKLINYGYNILEHLEDIREHILFGSLSRAQLEHLSRELKSEKIVVDDVSLKQLIAEIELRAEVEIAKLSVSG